MMASARASTTRPSGVGVMPRAVRWNSGAPNMSSSSARALVTAGWLVDNCCATRVSDPSCRNVQQQLQVAHFQARSEPADDLGGVDGRRTSHRDGTQ